MPWWLISVYLYYFYLYIFLYYTDFLFHPTACFPVKSLKRFHTHPNQPWMSNVTGLLLSRRFHTSHGHRLKVGKLCCNERCQWLQRVPGRWIDGAFERVYTPEDKRLEHNSLEVDGKSFSFLNGWFVGSMLIFQGVSITYTWLFNSDPCRGLN